MEQLILIIHVLCAVGLIGLVLLQQGKGATMGASFGSGASQTLFGASGSVGFLGKLTAVFALVFFLTSFGLAVLSTKKAEESQEFRIEAPAVVEGAAQEQQVFTPEELVGDTVATDNAEPAAAEQLVEDVPLLDKAVKDAQDVPAVE